MIPAAAAVGERILAEAMIDALLYPFIKQRVQASSSVDF